MIFDTSFYSIVLVFLCYLISFRVLFCRFGVLIDMAAIYKSHPEAFRRGPRTAGNFRNIHNNNSGICLTRKFEDIEGDFANDGPPPAKRRRNPNIVDPMWRRQEERLGRLCLREEKDSYGNERTVEEEEQPSCSEGSDMDVYYTRETIERLSPSRRDGINYQNETILRFSYVSFLQNLGTRLQLPHTTIATAIVLCHRFFLRRSHASHDRFLIATASMFLVAKSEDNPRPLNRVLIVSYEICHKHDLANFHYSLPNDWFEQYKQRVLEAENLVLTTLDFELTVQHPYRPLLSVLNKIGFAQTALVHVAWNLITEGLRSSLCLQFKPDHIAAGAVFLAAKYLNIDLSSTGELWQEFQTSSTILQDVVQQLTELF